MPAFPNINPTYAIAKKKKTRTLKNEFGDGYHQRAGDGINVVREIWEVEFTKPESTIDTIDDFLEAREGYESFTWTAPRASSSKNYICEEWTRGFLGGDVDTLTATFTEVFDL